MGANSTSDTTTKTTDSVGSSSGIVTSDSLLEDPTGYVSSAEQNSGKVSHKKRNIIIGVVIGVLCLLGIIISFLYSTRKNNNNNHNNKDNSTNKDVENNNNNH